MPNRRWGLFLRTGLNRDAHPHPHRPHPRWGSLFSTRFVSHCIRLVDPRFTSYLLELHYKEAVWLTACTVAEVANPFSLVAYEMPRVYRSLLLLLLLLLRLQLVMRVMTSLCVARVIADNIDLVSTTDDLGDVGWRETWISPPEHCETTRHDREIMETWWSAVFNKAPAL